jgi:hypothetical protein
MSTTNVNLSVGGDTVQTNDVTKGETIDVVERDPTRMNDHVKVTFEEVFAEPHPTVFAFDGVWTTSYKTFTNTKLWCYRISTLLCAVPLSIIWGIYFALLACCTIWCCRPCIKCYEIKMSCFRGFLQAVLDSICRPCYESFGYLFYNIRIRMIKGDS